MFYHETRPVDLGISVVGENTTVFNVTLNCQNMILLNTLQSILFIPLLILLSLYGYSG